jgi:hypothetical protein
MTCAGERPAGRLGASVLRAAGLDRLLLPRTRGDYLAVARRVLARSGPRLLQA